MSQRRLKLGANLNGVGNSISFWRHPDIPVNASVSLGFYQKQARIAEKGKFDLLLLQMVSSSTRSPILIFSIASNH